MIRHQILLKVGILVSLFWAGAASGDWTTSEGPPSRTRNLDKPLEEELLVPVWSLETTGPPRGYQLGELDGDDTSELVFVAGGRAKALEEGGRVEWQSEPLGLAVPAALVDLDGDLRPEVVLVNEVSGATVLSGVDGRLIWQSPNDFSRIGRVLIRDLDGDLIPELLVTEVDCGPTAHNVGRTAIYNYGGWRACRALSSRRGF